MKKILPCLLLFAALSMTGCTLYDPPGDSDKLVTLQDQDYFQKVRKAVLTNDKQWLSTQIALPLCCFPDREHSPVRSREYFIQHYDEIVNPWLRAVIDRQDRQKLTKDWAGVVVGNGVMWIVPFGPVEGPVEKYRIFAIKNTPPAGWTPAPPAPERKPLTFSWPWQKKTAPEAAPAAPAISQPAPATSPATSQTSPGAPSP
jgi:hypothetical protein